MRDDRVVQVDRRSGKVQNAAAVKEKFGVAPEHIPERLFYASSVLHCLPVGRCAEHSAQTGTLMRPDTLRAYATEAGFTRVTVLPIEDDMFRFYRLEG